jgi:hypothetical protein
MQVTCVANSGKSLPEFYRCHTPHSQFDIAVSHHYSVYGMCLFKGVLHYLIDSQLNGRPNWYPAVLFNVVDGTVPKSWRFSFSPENEENAVSAVWGYEELVTSGSHFDGLAERDMEALRIFVKRRMELDVEAKASSPERAAVG